MDIVATARKIRNKIFSRGFRFNRPLVLLQSDDWGRVGVRDRDGCEELRAAGLNLGERPYDLYSLETAEDMEALAEELTGLRDSAGHPASIGMNFVLANVDFAASVQAGFREIALKPVAEGLPGGWRRPGLLESYRSGIASGVFSPALHGVTHFCQPAVITALAEKTDRGELLRTLWRSETPYIHWRMPWVGYEYWNPEKSPEDRFLPACDQEKWIQLGARYFREMFGETAVSACAPGYRAGEITFAMWRAEGIRVAQGGPGAMRAPHFDSQGLLHTYRSLDFEPALSPAMRWEDCLEAGEAWLTRGLPLIVSVHSINFHSTLAGFRQRTLPLLRGLLSALQAKFPDLLYINDKELLEIVETGTYERGNGIRVAVRGEA